jgi:hypothetical protein
MLTTAGVGQFEARRHTNLSRHWRQTLSAVTAKACRAYAATRTASSARRSLEVLRAAIRYWHREYGPLPSVPRPSYCRRSVNRERSG